MNISANTNNFNNNSANLAVVSNDLVRNKSEMIKSDDYLHSAGRVNKTNNLSLIDVDQSINKAQAESQPNDTARSKNNINPDLLDKVFKLKSKKELNEISINRPSDLYLQTEILASAHVSERGIGLDVYV